MLTDFPPDGSIEYIEGADETPDSYPDLEAKLERAIDVTARGLRAYDAPAILWTGGKDSTLTLYIVREVAERDGHAVPPVIFIDHFQHFPEILDFVERWANEWDLDLRMARNDDVGSLADEPGEKIAVEALNEENRRQVKDILEYEEETFRFLLDTYVGNHLLKTVPMNAVIESNGFDAIMSGVRWDEQAARADETFFSPRHDADLYPPHDRIHPILPFTERDVWDATWSHVVPDAVSGYPAGYVPSSAHDLPGSLEPSDLPVAPQYFDGFRSLGSEVSTEKSRDDPAWLQDLEDTTERAGRAQDKEDLMERLRDLGYM